MAENVSMSTPPPYPRLFFQVVMRSSRPAIGHSWTSAYVLTDVFKIVPVRPTPAQPDHDATATHHHRRRHLDKQQTPRRRVPLAQRVLAATRVLVLFSSRAH